MKGYWLQVWQDTRAALGGWPAIVSMVIFPAVGLALHFWRDGRDAMSAEAYIWALYVLAPLGAVFLCVFLWNMVTTPYRIQRDRADAAEKSIAESALGTPFPNTVLRSLADSQTENEGLKQTLVRLSLLVEQYQRLLDATFRHAEFLGNNLHDDDIGMIATFIADEAKKALPRLPSRPDTPLVFETGWNTYRYILPSPMRIPPRVSFPSLPNGVNAEIRRVSKIDFEVRFWHSASPNQEKIEPQHFEADAEL